jgi:hypothetical protein
MDYTGRANTDQDLASLRLGLGNIGGHQGRLCR